MSRAKKAEQRRRLRVLRGVPLFVRIHAGCWRATTDTVWVEAIRTMDDPERWGYQVLRIEEGPNAIPWDAKGDCAAHGLAAVLRAYDELGRYTQTPVWAPHAAWVKRSLEKQEKQWPTP